MACVTVRFAHGAVLGVLYRPLQCHTILHLSCNDIEIEDGARA